MALNALLDACLRGNNDFCFCHLTTFLHQLELGNPSVLKGKESGAYAFLIDSQKNCSNLECN